MRFAKNGGGKSWEARGESRGENRGDGRGRKPHRKGQGSHTNASRAKGQGHANSGPVQFGV
ncbi:hypothetical protein [Breoghania sp.]|uniref:hypothetical protein n=1 Tax=Breoghania sp. TaxID=2065378 RepID=UPI00262F74CE|nr:hypothetical protein [Breoghania sp.]MDJ0932042.1 hypothetical protein [Breoghania sp.]